MDKASAEMHSDLSQLRQIIVVRRDLPLPMGFLINQITHASLATVYPFLMEPTAENQQRLHINAPEVFLKFKGNVTGWLNASFKKVILQTSSANEFVGLKEALLKARTPFVLIKEQGPIRIGKLMSSSSTDRTENYFVADGLTISPYTSENSYVENSFVWLKPIDGEGTETVIAVPPIEREAEPKHLKFLKLLSL